MKFRKKPVVIEAAQYAGRGNMNPRGGLPDWLWKALENGTAYFVNGADPLMLRTLEGPLTVSPNDWIIQGVHGELYPCKPDIFAATYERVEASPEKRLRQGLTRIANQSEEPVSAAIAEDLLAGGDGK